MAHLNYTCQACGLGMLVVPGVAPGAEPKIVRACGHSTAPISANMIATAQGRGGFSESAKAPDA